MNLSGSESSAADADRVTVTEFEIAAQVDIAVAVEETVSPLASGEVRASVLQHFASKGDEEWQVSGASLFIVVAPDIPASSLPSQIIPASQGHPLSIATRITRDTSADAPCKMVTDLPIWSGVVPLNDHTLFRVADLATLGTPDRHGEFQPAVEPAYPLRCLPDRLAHLFAHAYKLEPRLRAGGAQYVVAFVRTLHPPDAWKALRERRAREERRTNGAPSWPELRLAHVVEGYLRGSLDLFDAAPRGSPRGYYHQYDSQTQQIGYLAFGRSAAVLGGLSEETFYTFGSLLQSGEMATEGGLTRASLAPTLSLIGQWNSNQDVRENVDQVAALRRSGDASTQGQIWISYALAVIGVALAFISYLYAPILLAPGLIALGVSCILSATHASRAHSRSSRYWLAGAMFFWVGAMLCLAALLIGFTKTPLPFLPFLPQPGTPTPTQMPAPTVFPPLAP